MKLDLQSPFKEVWAKGYLRTCTKDRRKRVDLFNSDSDRTTISYARYLMGVQMGCILPKSVEVDHIDEDCCNDDINNLKVLSIDEHRIKTSKERSAKKVILTLVCPYCEKEFTKEKRLIKPNSTPKCSRSCNAKYNIKFNGWGKRKET